MRRFQTPLLRLLRVRRQAERMARLEVARARSEVAAAQLRLAAAQQGAEQVSEEIELRLRRPGTTLLIQQAVLELQLQQAMVERRLAEHFAAEGRLNASIATYRLAQQEREKVERAVDQRRHEHHRESLRIAAVELQEWAVRPTVRSLASNVEEPGDA